MEIAPHCRGQPQELHREDLSQGLILQDLRFTRTGATARGRTDAKLQCPGARQPCWRVGGKGPTKPSSLGSRAQTLPLLVTQNERPGDAQLLLPYPSPALPAGPRVERTGCPEPASVPSTTQVCGHTSSAGTNRDNSTHFCRADTKRLPTSVCILEGLTVCSPGKQGCGQGWRRRCARQSSRKREELLLSDLNKLLFLLHTVLVSSSNRHQFLPMSRL